MSAPFVIDPASLRPVLAEFGIRGDLSTISGGECRLECIPHAASAWVPRLEKLGYEVLSRTDLHGGGRSVIWFRMKAAPEESARTKYR